VKALKRIGSSFVRRTAATQIILRGLCCLGVVAALILIASSPAAMARIQAVYAHVTGWILNLLGENAAVLGNTVQTSQFGISVVTACTGIFLTGLFAVAVVALPARIRSTAAGLGIGILGIAAFNVIRLVSLYYIGVHLPGILDLAHVVIWQSLLILAAVAIWIAWAGAQRRTSGRHGGAS